MNLLYNVHNQTIVQIKKMERINIKRINFSNTDYFS